MSAVGILLLWAVAITGFSALFADGQWRLPVLLAAFIALGIEWQTTQAHAKSMRENRRKHSARDKQTKRFVAILVHLGGALFVIGWTVFPDTLIAGVFPSPSTLTELIAATQDARSLIRQSAAPIESDPPFVSVATLTVWWCAAVSGAALWGASAPALSAAPPLTVFIAAHVYSNAHSGGLPLGALLVAVALLVIGTDYRRFTAKWTQTLAPVALAAIPLLFGSLLGPILPGYDEPPLLHFRTTVGTYIGENPLVDIRPRLTDPSDTVVFYGRADQPSYWRLTSLDHFDGHVFSASTNPPFLRAPTSDPLTHYRVYIQNLSSPWIPAIPFPVENSSFLYSTDKRTDTADLETRTENNTAYSMLSRRHMPSFEDLHTTKPADIARTSHYLKLPNGLAPTLQQWAQGIKNPVNSSLSPFERMLAFRTELRSFTYTLETDSGHTAKDIETFLTNPEKGQRGYCELFAVAMAALARAEGVPSRVAIGYLPGKRVTKNIDNEQVPLWAVRGHDAHAWTELWFPGHGWIVFDATPPDRVKLAPSYLPSEENSKENPEENSPGKYPPSSEAAETPPHSRAVPLPPPPASVPESTPPDPSPSKNQKNPTNPQNPEKTSDNTNPKNPLPARLFFLATAVVGIVPCVLASRLVRKKVRRYQRRKKGVIGAWEEAISLMTDAGCPPTPAKTPQEQAREAEKTGILLTELAGLYVEYVFGPDKHAGANPTHTGQGSRQTRDKRHEASWQEIEKIERHLRETTPARARRVSFSRQSLHRSSHWSQRLFLWKHVPFFSQRDRAGAGAGAGAKR